MKVKFSLFPDMSWDGFISKIANDSTMSEAYQVEDGGVYISRCEIEDEQVNCRPCFVDFYGAEDLVVVTTSWSGYEYRIFPEDGGIVCVYEGAYRGLLSQNLLPEVLKDMPYGNLRCATVESSMLNGELLQYAILQSKLALWRAQQGIRCSNYHPSKIWVMYKDILSTLPSEVEFMDIVERELDDSPIRTRKTPRVEKV